MRHVRWDDHTLAWPEQHDLATKIEFEFAFQYVGDLLINMSMLRHLGACFRVHKCNGHLFGVDAPGRKAAGDFKGLDVGEVIMHRSEK